jgi:hypothetical protein
MSASARTFAPVTRYPDMSGPQSRPGHAGGHNSSARSAFPASNSEPKVSCSLARLFRYAGLQAMARSSPTVTRSFAATAPRAASRNASALSARHHDLMTDAAVHQPPRRRPTADGRLGLPFRGWPVQTRLQGRFDQGRIDRDTLDAASAWRHWQRRSRRPACRAGT